MPRSVVTTGIWKRGGEGAHLFRAIAVDDSTARIDQRPFTFAQQIKEGRASFLRYSREAQRLHARFVTAEMEQTTPLKRTGPVLNIFRNVDHNRPGTPAPGHLKSRAHGSFEFLGFVNQEDVLGTRDS